MARRTASARVTAHLLQYASRASATCASIRTVMRISFRLSVGRPLLPAKTNPPLFFISYSVPAFLYKIKRTPLFSSEYFSLFWCHIDGLAGIPPSFFVDSARQEEHCPRGTAMV